ncbi:M67 family metallopeptidase [Capillimicrobium parvum]|uniref:CysO-cysteine peptidase n=1 Tax=Capillimicrobium parvum TaxID=2884022 RepID=A0A9E6Y0C1_9ACTN|nr:M67 family metallopeptidase [Capillimicrobium parvum]UGS37714.1 CysO-cysteine peptidase [Capillimicrobium parvum]
MRVAPALLKEIIAHAREEAPNECCGLVAVRDGEATDVRRAVNQAASPLKFEVDGLEVLHVLDEFEDAGAELGAIYHSHTRTPPYPSQTDINFAANWPGVEWIIVGLDRGGEATVRTYLIEDGNVREL